MTRNKRKKAKEFSSEAKKGILVRDSGCIFCRSGRFHLSDGYGKEIFDIAHVVNKSQGGLGIEQNGVTACRLHHHQLDNGNKGWREEMQQYIENYMRERYPEWDRDKLIYKKWEGNNV